MPETLEADYVVTGCGASGMAFTDVLVAHSKSSVIMIDSHHQPGGHWNDAYPFVRLPLPSHFYGAHSLDLGDRSVNRGGLNDGLLQMASGSEVVAYYDRLMQHRLLATGRMTTVSMSNQARSAAHPDLMAWLTTSRLDPAAALLAKDRTGDPDKQALVERARRAMREGLPNLQKLVAQLEPLSTS